MYIIYIMGLSNNNNNDHNNNRNGIKSMKNMIYNDNNNQWYIMIISW